MGDPSDGDGDPSEGGISDGVEGGAQPANGSLLSIQHKTVPEGRRSGVVDGARVTGRSGAEDSAVVTRSSIRPASVSSGVIQTSSEGECCCSHDGVHVDCYEYCFFPQTTLS